jgi:hypothetical protein
MLVLNIIVIVIAIYLSLGVVFAIPFIMRGVTKIDEGANDSKWGFRVIIIPGTIIFWPFLLKKWVSVSKMVKND